MVSPTRRMWLAMSAQRRELSLAGIIGMLASVCAVALLGTSAWLISTAAEMPPVLTLTVAAVMVRAFALGRAIFRYVERLVGHDAAFRGLSGLRESVYSRLEQLAPVGLVRFARGDLLNRLVADVDAALDLPLRVVLPWVQAALVSAATVAFCMWLSPSAGLLIGVLVVIALTIAPWVVGRLAMRAEQHMAPTRGVLSSAVVTSVSANADLLANDQTQAATSSTEQVDHSLTALTRRSALALGFGGGLSVALQGVAVVGALALAIPRVVDGSLSPVWLAVIALVPLALFEVTGTLPAAALALERVRGSADRLAAVEDQPDPVKTPEHPKAVPSGSSRLDVVGLSASWAPEQLTTIRDITFSVISGQRVWIVGPSGAGKSTLATVLLGFLDYQGSARINGVDLCETGDALHDHVGLLAQRSHVFDTTISQNISLGRVPPDDPRIAAAAEAAQLTTLISTAPDGLETLVGTFGTSVSGGEAQRIALARLLLDPPGLLVLDEPTEHLDAQTAAALAATIHTAAAGAAMIVITHRLREIPDDEHVLVMQRGTISARGTSAELAVGDSWFAERLREEREEADMAELIAGLPSGIAVPHERRDGP